jgi:cyclopropane fatty-acyl-phospholipid synthase-like methyltransferase
MPTDYDRAYGETLDLFGADPERTLVDYAARLDRGRPVLDLGAGQGRNTFYVARRGFEVHALDPSSTAVETIERVAAERGLSVRGVCSGFDAFDAEPQSYGGVMVFGLLQILRWDAIELLVRKLETWTATGGLVWVTAFGTGDPAYGGYRDAGEEIGRNSFAVAGKELRTFLEPGQVLELLDGFEPVHHWEGLGPEHRHGDGPVERHFMVEAVARRRRK